MKIRDFVPAVILLFIAQSLALADRQLNRTEILQIFKTLTNQPRKTWIPCGVIEATHLEYKPSNGYMIESTVVVKYDGDRFYWETNIDSYTRQTEPQLNPRSNSSGDDFDLSWNKKRVFAWDGERYTMYFRPSNRAIVNENPNDVLITVNGPLTAGIIPWGYGMYTLESLSAAESSAVEVVVNAQKQVHLTLKKADTPEMVFVLDPTKDYAVLSCSASRLGCLSVTKTYGNYKLVSSGWIPTSIIIEQYNRSKKSPELLSYDCWDFTSIRVSSPHPASFCIQYETDALVEYYSLTTDKPLSYRYYDEVDIDSLLQERLSIASAHNTQAQNCATLAVKYVLARLGKNVTGEELAELVNEPNKVTSLYALRQFSQELGFHCLAVKTDIATLKNLNACQVILHLPGPNHFVVLEYIDDEYIWIIDLDSNKLYYRTKLNLFKLDWNAGIALIVSNEPLNLTGNFTELSDEQLNEIIGGFPKYDCTDLIQEYDVVFCSEMIGGLCGSVYIKFYNRYGCEEDPNGGTCAGTDLVGNVWCVCIEDPQNPGACVGTGDWYSQYIRACR
jgi:bacteriocin-like protein